MILLLQLESEIGHLTNSGMANAKKNETMLRKVEDVLK